MLQKENTRTVENDSFLSTQTSCIHHPTFRQMGERYLEACRPEWKESSYLKYSNALHHHVYPYLGGCDVHTITRQQLDQMTQTLLTQGNLRTETGLSPRSVQSILLLVHAVLLFGIDHMGMTYSVPRYQRVRTVRNEPLILTRRQQKTLLDYTAEIDNQKILGVLIALHLGLRLGEVCALRWENIGMEDQILSVRNTMQRISSFTEDSRLPKTRIIITDPKTRDSIRDLPIPNHLMSRLKAARKQSEGPKAFLLTGKRNHFVENRSLEYYFSKILKDSGLPHFHFHCLRHTFATRCIEAGIDAKTVSALLGHSSVNTTLNYYVHITMTMKKETMDRLTLYMNTIL